MENVPAKVPTVFWVIAIMATLWNMMGIFAYLSDMFISPEKLSVMKPAMQELYKNNPIYLKMLYGLGVFGGLLGSVGLLLRKSWAVPFFLISLVSVVLQFATSLLFTNTLNAMGNVSLVLPAFVILIAAFLFGYARYLRQHNVLNR